MVANGFGECSEVDSWTEHTRLSSHVSHPLASRPTAHTTDKKKVCTHSYIDLNAT